MVLPVTAAMNFCWAATRGDISLMIGPVIVLWVVSVDLSALAYDIRISVLRSGGSLGLRAIECNILCHLERM